MQAVERMSAEGKARIEALLSRAASDIEFRELLLQNPEQALEGVELTVDERIMLTNLRRVGLEEWGVDVRLYRSFLRDNGAKVVEN